MAWPRDTAVSRRERALEDTYRWSGGALGIDPDEHRAEPCHAAAIDPDSAGIIWLCTDPGRHARWAAEDREAAQRRAPKRRQAEVAKARREYAVRALAGRLDKERIVERALRRQINGATVPVAALACELLGLEPTGETGRLQAEDYRRALGERLSGGEASPGS